jgi:hypothetical protein
LIRFRNLSAYPLEKSEIVMTSFDPALDPAMDAPDLDAARRRANYGDVDPRSYASPTPHPDVGTRAAPPLMPLDIAVAQGFLTACMTSHPRVAYGLGSKVPFFKARPGVDFAKVDCSGFVREAIREATMPLVPFPDGSVVQHDWIIAQHYKKTTVSSGKLTDGRVRIAFLSPTDTSSGIGHVVLIHNGLTLESHGGVGPDSRPWNGESWQAVTTIYELTGLPSSPPATS